MEKVRKIYMKENELPERQPDEDPFGLKNLDFSKRKPEKSELFTAAEIQTYIDQCDYPETADDLLLAWEIQRLFGAEKITDMITLDAMCGPGRLGREFLALGATRVAFHDGSEQMLSHAKNEATKILLPEQVIGTFASGVDEIPVKDDIFDLIVCHNSTHQLSDEEKLKKTLEELLRITKPGGHIVIADFQRDNTPAFKEALTQRLKVTREGVRDLLRDSFFAAFSKDEFENAIRSIPGVKNLDVIDAPTPILTPEQRIRVDQDFIKGHEMDFSPISQRVIIQKKDI